MSKANYSEEELMVIQQHGDPVYENWQPMNESARILTSMKLARARNKAGKRSTEVVAKETIDVETKKLTSHIPDPDLKEEDLLPFSSEEVRIIRQYFFNVNQSHTEIGAALGIPYQRVTAFLHSEPVKRLYNKVFKSLLPIEALLTIRAGLRKGDSKLAMEVLRDAGVMKSSEMNINVRDSQPLSDPKVIEQLKALGDSVSTEIINKEP